MIETPSKKGGDDRGKQDWWDRFKTAVADPDVNLYKYLQNDIIESIGAQTDKSFGENLTRAQKRGIKKILAMKEPQELSRRLKWLEQQMLFLDFRTRMAIKLFRVTVDTVAVQEKKKENQEKAKDPDIKPGEKMKDRLDLHKIEKRAFESVNELAKDLDAQDRKEVREIVSEAASQIEEDKKWSRKTLKFLDGASTIAIAALPLLTWKYRWALAAGLGLYSSRKSFYHGYKAGHAYFSGDTQKIREELGHSAHELKEAGGKVIAVALTPFFGRLGVVGSFLSSTVTGAWNTSAGFIIRKVKGRKEGEDMKGELHHLSKDIWNNTDGILMGGLKAADKATNGRYPGVSMAMSVAKRLSVKKTSEKSISLIGALKKRFGIAASGEEQQEEVAKTVVSSKPMTMITSQTHSPLSPM